MKHNGERIALMILLALIVCALVLAGVLLFLRTRSGQVLGSEEDTQAGVDYSVDGKWNEGIITYNGRHYEFNPNQNIYLFLGIDKNGVVEEAEDFVSGGQSDAIFLLVTNSETEEFKIVSVNRNTMTDVEVFDREGNNLGTYTAQICVQHGYGDGKKYSCTLAVNAVSKLFYNLPIDGYMAINMGGIPAMNDAVGGVTVEVLQDLSFPSGGVELTKGETVTLTGTEAYYYLHGRDTSEFGSATDRLRRQEQYLGAFFNQLHEQVGNSASGMLDIYNAISDYLVTNMDVTSILSDVAAYAFTEDNLYTVPGETVMGDKFEEFYVDEDAFYEMYLEVFYEEVD